MSTYIFESKKIESILDFIDLDTFFIFDIDHTLIEAQQVIGTSHWEKHLKHRLIDQGISPDEAKLRAYMLWKSIQEVTGVQPIEQGIFRLVSLLQNNSIPILGLTSRDRDLIEITFRQLESVDLHNVFTLDYPSQPLEAKHICHFSRGTVFCGDNPKNVGLKAFFNQISFKPKKIVFVDDQKEHLYELEDMAFHENIDFVGMQYMGSSHDRFNPVIAEIQEQHLPRILSNADALKLIRGDL
jgi:hypothetical protein